MDYSDMISNLKSRVKKTKKVRIAEPSKGDEYVNTQAKTKKLRQIQEDEEKEEEEIIDVNKVKLDIGDKIVEDTIQERYTIPDVEKEELKEEPLEEEKVLEKELEELEKQLEEPEEAIIEKKMIPDYLEEEEEEEKGEGDESEEEEGGDEEEEEEEEEEEDEGYLQKFKSEINKKYLEKIHPECIRHNNTEVNVLTQVVRNESKIIIDDLHRTLPYLTKYEKARVIGQRAKQLDMGAEPFIEVDAKIIDGYIIAEMELLARKIPFIIRRPIPDGGSEYWNLKDLEII
jgi:DNA-directed RNA polymerase I, II, and III subunit RPABC2